MSDGRFSSKPIRSGQTRDKSWQATDFTADSRLLTDAARAFVQSNLVQHEINALMEYPFPEAAASLTCAPLHKAAPAGARELGRPLASAVLVQEYLIGLLFLRVCGWIFMLFGALCLLGALIFAIQVAFNENIREKDPLAAVVLVVLGIGISGAGAWFGVFRGRVIDEMCWFCPRGMIWRIGAVFDWYTWEEVRELYCRLETHRPAIGIRLESNLSFISFSNTPASRLQLDYLESRASAACAPIVLQQIAEGSSVRFGDWRLSRTALRDADTEIDWHDVSEVRVRDRELHICRRGERDITISLEEVPFPKLFTALTRGIHAYARG
jgi:hypothetical protein